MHMKRYLILWLDVFVILVATVLGLVIRDNFEISPARLMELSPYFLATLIASVIAVPAFSINRLIWRFSSLPDYLRILVMLVGMTIGSLVIGFAFNRLENVPRSLAFLQFNLSLTFMIGLRIVYRLHHLRRRCRPVQMAPLKVVDQQTPETILLVGVSRLTETYLQALKDFAPPNLRIAGLLGHKAQHVGRIVASYKILCTAEGIERTLLELKISGVVIDRVIVTVPMHSLSDDALAALGMVEQSTQAKIEYLSEKLGFDDAANDVHLRSAVVLDQRRREDKTFAILDCELQRMRQRRYWKAKRAIDFLASLSLLICLFPIMLFMAVSVLFGMGRPVVFWQQRPGLGGRPFRLFKFRTMGSAYASDGRELSDAERLSRVGGFLRRTRLDELPQLFNILRGDMSFIGPRPLLPRDQDVSHRARLLVRPGLTGWAQVIGGRAISAQDKAALDIWYVKHATLWLDLRVALKTIPIVLFGESISRHQIESAWKDLRNPAVLNGNLSVPKKRHAA
jgi:lipopolysaccharide/colanic/teichoic acid biosynthesis glycosyltransferase